jgi:hypothetical protein
MALRRQNLSPTATLLRNSRLFSLPNPLPRPAVSETFGTGTYKVSDSATLPYPTHQAIATTPKSLARGDWGLKRAIPSRSRIVQTSNPVLVVKQLDTIEHVTDYDSAADHVRTRQKFEQLGIPMMRGMQALRETGGANIAPSGSFEYRSDVTSYEADEGLDEAAVILNRIKESIDLNSQEQKIAQKDKRDASFVPYTLPLPDSDRHNARRWKFEGPWLPGMDAQEFTDYVKKELHSRREEFDRVLTQYVKNEIYTTRQSSSRNSQTLPLDPAEAEEAFLKEQKRWSDISEKDIAAGIKALRQEAATDALQSKLFQRLIAPFLRLPTLKFKNINFNDQGTKNDAAQYRFDDESAPLSTHPSTGLGYLRTNAYISNHPILGPQREREPVTARVIQPQDIPGRIDKQARLGIAGFVTRDSEIISQISQAYTHAAKRAAEIFDHRTPGGAKVEVHPRFASVTIDGRIHMKIVRSEGAPPMVKRGEFDDMPPARAAQAQANVQPLDLFHMSQGQTLDENSEQARSLKRIMENAREEEEGRRNSNFEEGTTRAGLAEALRSEADAPR